jgi:hypothetical protein
MGSVWASFGFMGLLLLAAVGESLFVGTEPAMTKDDLSGRTQKPAAAPEPKDGDDFRWLLDRAKDRDGLDPFYKAILEKLEKSKIPTVDRAKGVAVEYKRKSEGLDAREGWKVVGLLRIGINVADFADSGDLIWVVRFSLQGAGLSQEMWINSTTGAIRTMLPVRRKPN